MVQAVRGRVVPEAVVVPEGRAGPLAAGDRPLVVGVLLVVDVPPLVVGVLRRADGPPATARTDATTDPRAVLAALALQTAETVEAQGHPHAGSAVDAVVVVRPPEAMARVRGVASG